MDKNEITILIKAFLEKARIEPEKLEEEEGETLWLNLEVRDSYLFLDREGEGLSALNHLARKIIEKNLGANPEEKSVIEIMIDINGFQKKRVENIRAVAHMMAERARYFKSN